MCGYPHSHFLNIKSAVRNKIDVLLHGYGFDFLFRGKYLPHDMHPFMKKLTYHRNLRPIAKDIEGLSEDFIKSVSFRSKDMEVASLILPGAKNRVESALRVEIESIMNEAKTFSDDPYVWWEYACFHNISRHYTWLNLLSIRSFIEERTMAFDNDLFDLFWSMTPQTRNNGAAFTKAIKVLDPAMLSVRIANTNLKADDHPVITAGKLVVNKMLKDTGLNRVFTASVPPPALKERSWPVDADLIRNDAGIKERAIKVYSSSSLETLSFLNMGTVKGYVTKHMSGSGDYTNLIMNLITLDAFIGS
jgi:hypothetical protein